MPEELTKADIPDKVMLIPPQSLRWWLGQSFYAPNRKEMGIVHGHTAVARSAASSGGFTTTSSSRVVVKPHLHLSAPALFVRDNGQAIHNDDETEQTKGHVESELLEEVSLEELDLKNVIHAHEEWLSRLRNLVISHTGPEPSREQVRPASVHDARTCPFGKWLSTKTPSSFKDPRMYDFLVSTHEKFHTESSSLIALSLEDPEEAMHQVSAEDSPINSVSKRLLSSLNLMHERQVSAAFT
eukprot:m51a1_g2301 hypothetical protein (241) ;mRNA; r:443836-444942